MARGDRDALGELFSRYAPRLLSIGVAIIGNPSDAEDVLHDVFLEAFRQSGQFDPGRGSVISWLVIRMRSRSLDRKKSKAMRPSVSEAAMQHTAGSTAASEEVVEPDMRALDHRRLAAALADLERPHVEVLLLGYFEDLSFTEIAERLDLPVGTIKSRARRALSLLRDRLRAKERAS